MTESPIQIIVAAFKDEKSADQALKALKQAQKEKQIDIKSAAVLRKDAKGKLHISEVTDMSPKKGAVLGGVAGAVIGVIAGPALLVPAAVGAVVGGLTGKLRDTGFNDARLKSFGENLTPGSSAIVAVVEHVWVAAAEKALAEAGADAMTAALGADVAAQLEAGHQVAYTAISSKEGFSAARVAGGADSIEASKVVVDDTGAYTGHFFATPEGFVIEGASSTIEGDTYIAAAGTFDKEAGAEELPKSEGLKTE